MNNLEMENMKNILEVYKMQHYFIDRHEIMAEKTLTVILVLTTIISAIITFNFNDICNKYLAIPFCFYIICFCISIVEILRTIQPLSSKKMKGTPNFENFNREWPKESVIYYRGIISIMEKALKENKSLLDEYYNLVNNQNFYEDLIKQIYILAQYSDYKRKRLEKAKRMSSITVFMGTFCILAYIFFSVFGNMF